MLPLFAIAASLVVGVLAEYLHHRRVRRVAHLAFGAAARPRRWVRTAAPLRVVALAAVGGASVVLWQCDRTTPLVDTSPAAPRQHLTIALDVSPSMQIADAGASGKQPRADRAREVLRSVLERLDLERVAVSVVAFYSTARPVVVDTVDPEVVANIIDDLPLEQAFAPGKTDLYSGVEAADRLGRTWADGSARLVVVSDGDSLPAKQIVKLPPAFRGVVVAGIGSARRGTYIDGHSSRQNAASLEQLARRLEGTYCDANNRHIPSDLLRGLAARGTTTNQPAFALRDYAIATLAGGAAILALLPLTLALAGRRTSPMPRTAAGAEPRKTDCPTRNVSIAAMPRSATTGASLAGSAFSVDTMARGQLCPGHLSG